MILSEETDELLSRLRGGDGQAVGTLFDLHRQRLWQMLVVRLDRRLSSRLSADDVLQEAFFDVARRIGEYVDDPSVPFYVWLRFLTLQRMQMLQRVHIEAEMRSVGREVPIAIGSAVRAISESMAGQLISDFTSPSQVAIRHEKQERIRAALEEMDPVDREVLALRHFEELGNNEVATILGLSKDAASKRHIRALKRLRNILDVTSGS